MRLVSSWVVRIGRVVQRVGEEQGGQESGGRAGRSGEWGKSRVVRRVGMEQRGQESGDGAGWSGERSGVVWKRR